MDGVVADIVTELRREEIEQTYPGGQHDTQLLVDLTRCDNNDNTYDGNVQHGQFPKDVRELHPKGWSDGVYVHGDGHSQDANHVHQGEANDKYREQYQCREIVHVEVDILSILYHPRIKFPNAIQEVHVVRSQCFDSEHLDHGSLLWGHLPGLDKLVDVQAQRHARSSHPHVQKTQVENKHHNGATDAKRCKDRCVGAIVLVRNLSSLLGCPDAQGGDR
mmetsp:Transcript_42094/g.105924  ORF Transcript_42094/g.105924 Transcript_42094/m.105924 type:complete len:219 (-) Transcript_42094:854-1510(-)